MDRFTKVVFNSNGSWTCPAGITRIIVWGMGGGSSGTRGYTNSGIGGSAGYSGVGQSLQAVILNVVPNTTYSITIGAGGAASSDTLGNAGGNTTFGALMTWAGAPSRINVTGGDAFGIFKYRTVVTSLPNNMAAYAGGGTSANGGGGANRYFGYPAKDGFSAPPGAYPVNSGHGASGSGGMGGEKIGGFGADGSPGNGFNGGDAANNSGAGGGAGGGAASGFSITGNGGAGGSGQLVIMWVE